MKRSSLAIGLIALSLSSPVHALDPLGPTKAIEGRNNWSIGVEYAFSETDTELSNVIWAGAPARNLPSDALQSNTVYVTPRYGVLDQIDVFGRIGAVTMESPILTTERFEGSVGLAWGVGAAATVYDSERFDWGILAQWSRGQSEQERINPNSYIFREMEIDTLQIATGPTYQVREDLDVYAGGFYYTLDGEFHDALTPFDLENQESFGGFVGLNWAVKENVQWNVEAQCGGSVLTFATGLKWLIQ